MKERKYTKKYHNFCMTQSKHSKTIFLHIFGKKHNMIILTMADMLTLIRQFIIVAVW